MFFLCARAQLHAFKVLCCFSAESLTFLTFIAAWQGILLLAEPPIAHLFRDFLRTHLGLGLGLGL